MLRGEERGFTFIELVMATVILGLLVALALPAYIGARSRAAQDEANHMANEWKSLAWGCYLQTSDVTQCESNTQIGFSEQPGQYWNWSLSATYQVVTSASANIGLTVSWPATGRAGLEQGQTYTVTLFVSETNPGQATSTCIPQQC
jgi:prepilin-type N-terminal cleavage/methylation domain-containing protein